MTIEIKKPELEKLIKRHLNTGLFHDTDELLTEALHALDELPREVIKESPRRRLIDVLSSPPFAGSELTIEREQDYPRPIEL